jgi:hypothetical protein
MPGKHGPNRFDNYEHVHRKVMDGFLRDGFVLAEDLRFEDLGDGQITLTGTITCVGDILVEVEKALVVVDGTGATARVQTRYYRYHATHSGNGAILRYENSDHRDCDHVHRYDTPGTGVECSVTEITCEDDRPTLGEVLEELRQWYYKHFCD